MSIRRRKIANRIMRWFSDESRISEHYQIAAEVMSRPSRLSRYIEYHLRRL